MTYVLFLLTIAITGEYDVEKFGEFDTEDECLIERQYLIGEIGLPIMDYQVVCVPYRMAEDNKPSYFASIEKTYKV